MHELIFLQDLAMVMVVSAVIMIFCQRFHLPVVLGYIIAGVIIGPHTPPYALVHNIHSIYTLSELGVIFLLFFIGLEFNLTKLMKVGAVAFVAGTFEIIFMIWAGYAVGRAFGWNFMNSLFLGAILSISSTTIIAKVLMEMKKMQEKFAQVILGILIVEDLLAILIITILSGIATTGSLEVREIVVAMVKVGSFVFGILLTGFLIVPRILKYIARFQNQEMMVITVLGLCFAVSLIAAKSGFSVALGSFLIGAIIAETPQVREITHKMESIKDMFTAIFFVSVGMLIQPSVLVELWFPILVITLVTIFGKVISCSFATFLTGHSEETALKVGLGLAQIGEFSFIIARLGETTNVTSPFIYPIAVAVSGITTVTTPFLIKNTRPIIGILDRLRPRPMRTVLNLYTAWMEKVSAEKSGHRSVVWQKISPYIFRFMFYAFVSGITLYGLNRIQNRFQIFPGFSYGIVFAVAIVLAAGFVLWGSMQRIHERIERMVLEIFDEGKGLPAKKAKPAAYDDLSKLIQQEYPWEVQTEDFLLPYQPSAVNQSLGDLRLRSETGASIVAIYRDEESIPNPSPETKLLPGDVLLLMGDRDQIKAAVGFLHKKMKEPFKEVAERTGTPKTESFQISAGAACIGKTLKSLKLRRKTGVSVLGVQKAEITINNPDPETLLEAGDTLILFGWPDQITAAKAWLEE
ncbi:MAG: cation:proton antiporter [Candidatus Omnitrophica bacterium]|nr:cation:proton antiporter [Candidatus Omnitrophota bacterium]